jgi:hypothetical protein
MVGWAGLLIVFGLIYITGKWLKGVAAFTDISNMVAYASTVFLTSLISTFVGMLTPILLGFQYNLYKDVDTNSWSNTYYLIIQLHRYLKLWLIFIILLS